MNLNKIRLELARDHDFPTEAGSGATSSPRRLARTAGWQRKRLEDQSRPLPGASFLERRAGRGRSSIRKPGGSWAFHYDLLGDH